MTSPSQAGREPHDGPAHSQATPVQVLGPMRMRWNVVLVVKCSMYKPAAAESISRSSSNAPAAEVPVHRPVQAQLRTLARRSVPVFPSHMHASAVPSDDFGTA